MSVSLLYGMSFAFACIVFGVIIFIQEQKVENIFTLLSLVMLFVHFGYYALSMSDNLREALLAYKLTYLDGTIVPYLLLLCVMEICGFHRNKVVTRICIFPIAAYVLSLTAGYTKWYYADIEFFKEDGYSYITRTNGPLHVLGTICIVMFMLAPIMPVIYAYLHKNSVSYKYIVLCGVLVAINTIAYVIQKLAGISVEILPFQFNIVEIIIVYISYKISHHDIERQAYITKNRMKEYGFFAIDSDNKFLGCDDVAKFYFPELDRLAIDTVIKDKFIVNEFLVWNDYFIDDESTFKYFKRVNKDIKCRRKPLIINRFNNEHGYIYEIFNDTDNVKHISELRAAVEEAERANKSKSIFLSRMSHEIRTPINAIIGMDDVIMRETKDSKIKPYAKTIHSSAKMLLSLVNEVLDFSKIESGKMELVEEEYEEREVLFNVINMVRGRAINKDLELQLETKGDIPKKLYGDRLKNQEIIINFLTNAIKYTDIGSVKLRISALDIEDDMVEMRYDIIDTGIGIKDEDKTGLFDAFTRVDMKHNNTIEGTGLGLSITSSYVKMMGGRIEIESEFGKGSVFTAYIPQRKVSNETISNITIDDLDFDEEDVVIDKMLYAPEAKVLVVDDNITNLNVFKLLLEPTHIQIKDITSGKNAIEVLEKETFDIVFLDHMMPGLDGLQTLQIIKERKLIGEKTKAVVALTANAIGNAKEMYIGSGFTDYMSKPIEISNLLNLIEKYLPNDMYSYIELETDARNDEVDIAGEKDKLPQLEEFDFDYAIRHLGSANNVEFVAKDVMKNLPMAKEHFMELISQIDEEQYLKEYQIEVHTMKSTTASIGALLLSKVCRLLEMACKENDVSKVKMLHPILIDEIDKHYERLRIFNEDSELDGKEKTKKEITMEEFEQILDSLSEHLKDWDYDMAQKDIELLEEYIFAEDIKEMVDEIAEKVHNLNGAYALDLIYELRN